MTDVALTRAPGGYVLTVDPAAVDLHRFRRLLSESREAADHQQADELLGQALGL